MISQVTEAVLDEAKTWQSRPLEAIYPIVWMDGIAIKVQQDKRIINRSAHIILGVNLRGEKEVLGLWLAENEGAKFWLSALTEIKNRGVQDLCPEGVHLYCLHGWPDRVARCCCQRVSEHFDAALYCASGACQLALCQREGYPSDGGIAEAHLPFGCRR